MENEHENMIEYMERYAALCDQYADPGGYAKLATYVLKCLQEHYGQTTCPWCSTRKAMILRAMPDPKAHDIEKGTDERILFGVEIATWVNMIEKIEGDWFGDKLDEFGYKH
jgi:hypothetical protein